MNRLTAKVLQRILSNASTVFLIVLSGAVSPACGMEITPFSIANLSPLALSSGIPSETGSNLLKTGRLQLALSQDLASNYTRSSTATEQLLLDGELYRTNIALRYGVYPRLELGLELPLIMHGGGFMDNIITDWHSFWGLPQGGRDTAPDNLLRYRYTKDGVTRLNKSNATTGIGDISLQAAVQLHENRTPESHTSVALRSQLKLPTGDSTTMAGSGSTDLSLFLAGGVNQTTSFGTAGIFGSIGGIARTTGNLLPEQQNHAIGFTTAGFGLSPLEWLSFKLQLNLTSPLYTTSNLTELSGTTAMLTIGSTIQLPQKLQLDLAFAEDIAVATAPDVTFHIRLSRQF